MNDRARFDVLVALRVGRELRRSTRCSRCLGGSWNA